MSDNNIKIDHMTTDINDPVRDEMLAQGAGGSGPVAERPVHGMTDPVLREKTTQKLEGKKVRFRRWKNMSIGARISIIVLILIVLIAAFANFLAPCNPYEIFTARQAPSPEHLFGTDDKGRDVLSRLMYGGRYSLTIGLGATLFALIFGAIIGSIAAVVRPWISNLIMRILDIIMSFPWHRIGGNLRNRFWQFSSFAHIRYRLLVHSANCENRPCERHERVQPRLRSRRYRFWRTCPLDLDQARGQKLHRTCSGFHDRACCRRDRIRGVPVVHLRRHPRANSYLGQHLG